MNVIYVKEDASVSWPLPPDGFYENQELLQIIYNAENWRKERQATQLCL